MQMAYARKEERMKRNPVLGWDRHAKRSFSVTMYCGRCCEPRLIQRTKKLQGFAAEATLIHCKSCNCQTVHLVDAPVRPAPA